VRLTLLQRFLFVSAAAMSGPSLYKQKIPFNQIRNGVSPDAADGPAALGLRLRQPIQLSAVRSR